MKPVIIITIAVIVGIIISLSIFTNVDTLVSDSVSDTISKIKITNALQPWGSCLEKFDILRDSGFATFSGGRMTEYQFEVYGEFSKDHCRYYVFSWMPEDYPERTHVGQGWYHEYRTDLTEEQIQNLIDVGAWPDEFGQFSIKEKTIEPEKKIVPQVNSLDVSNEFGSLGGEHSHAGILVKIFGDTFEFSGPAYHIKSSWIHFEGRDDTTIHKHATGVDLGYLFDTLSIGLDDQCYVFPDGKSYCSNEDYTLKFFINGEQTSDIRDYEIMEGDRVLILYGSETPEEIDAYLLQLENQKLLK